MANTMVMKPLLLVLVLLCSLTVVSQRKASVIPADLDHYIDQVLKTFEVPGLAIGVVKDGRVVLAKGYGVKDISSGEPVDAHTTFPIASNSKAFTGTALALLTEDGTLEWDAPVIKYLPWFRMADPYVTKEITVRDLLVHRSGIAPYAGDLLQFPPTNYSREEIVYRLRHLPLATSFRSTYAYDNVLYLVAAEVIKSVSGMEWEDFIRERIFKTVGMSESISRFSDFHSLKNKASSHAHVDGKLKILENFAGQGLGDASNPAGGIASNVHDMTKWLVTQLDSGRTPSGEVLFSPATTTELWSGVTPMPHTPVGSWIQPAQTDFNSYALGFRVYSYRGVKMVTHGGKLDGFVSFVNMIPEINAGIVVLTNQESSNAYRAIVNKIADHMLQLKPFDWIRGYRIEEDRRFERMERVSKSVTASRDPNARPSLPTERYAGNFYDAWYGNIKVTHKDGKLLMQFEHSPLLTGEMEFYQFNTFIVRWHHRDLKADAFVTYSLDEQGEITSVKMKAVSPVTDVSYDFHDLNILPVK